MNLFHKCVSAEGALLNSHKGSNLDVVILLKMKVKERRVQNGFLVKPVSIERVESYEI